MESLLFIGYEAVATLLPFCLALLMLGKRHRQQVPAYPVLLGVFALYLVGVFYFTGAGTLYDLLLYGLDVRSSQINLIPFSHTIDQTAYLLNVLLFVPLGILVPLIWDRLCRTLPMLGVSFGFSLLIELSQLLNNRSTDVDDLILNTLGGLVGFGLFRLWDRCTGGRFRLRGIPLGELPLYLFAAFLGRFFLYNEFGLAGLLYF